MKFTIENKLKILEIPIEALCEIVVNSFTYARYDVMILKILNILSETV